VFTEGAYESQHGNITLQTKGPVGYGQGTEASDFDDKYNALYKGTIRGIRRIRVWTQQYDGENICSGVQFFFAEKGNSSSLTPTDVYGGTACDAGGVCPIQYDFQPTEDNTAPITDVVVWTGTFINKMQFVTNKGVKHNCGESETGQKQNMNLNAAGKLGDLVYMAGRIWTLHGRRFISNLYATFTKPVN